MSSSGSGRRASSSSQVPGKGLAMSTPSSFAPPVHPSTCAVAPSSTDTLTRSGRRTSSGRNCSGIRSQSSATGRPTGFPARCSTGSPSYSNNRSISSSGSRTGTPGPRGSASASIARHTTLGSGGGSRATRQGQYPPAVSNFGSTYLGAGTVRRDNQC